jgi:hypothetical protein
VGLEDDMAKGADFILGLSNTRLHEFVKYYFELSVPNLTSMKKEVLQNILRPYLLDENGGADAKEEGWLELGTEAEM